MIENICTNRIKLNYHGNDDFKLDASSEISKLLNEKFKVVFEERELSLGLLNECVFESKWSAPIEMLSALSTNYDVDIIGVSYEFKDGYVESFEIMADIEEEEIGGFIKIDEKADLTKETPHFIEEDDILAEEDMLGMSDKELEEL